MAIRVNPETLFTNRVRKGLELYLPTSVVHKFHGDEYSEPGIPDLFGEVDGIYLAWEIKVRPNPLDEDQLRVLRRYNSLLAGVFYLDDTVGTAEIPEQMFFVRAKDLKDRWSYRRDFTHFRVPLKVEVGKGGNQTRLPRVDLLCKLLKEL